MLEISFNGRELVGWRWTGLAQDGLMDKWSFFIKNCDFSVTSCPANLIPKLNLFPNTQSITLTAFANCVVINWRTKLHLDIWWLLLAPAYAHTNGRANSSATFLLLFFNLSPKRLLLCWPSVTSSTANSFDVHTTASFEHYTNTAIGRRFFLSC